MWNGLTSLFFGATDTSTESVTQNGTNVEQLLMSNESDWVVVEVKDDDMENYLFDSVLLRSPELFISTHKPVVPSKISHIPDAPQALGPRARASVSRPYVPHRSLHHPAPRGELTVPRSRPYTCGKDSRNFRCLSRGPLKRANRTYEVETGCRRQRAFTYDIRNTRKC